MEQAIADFARDIARTAGTLLLTGFRSKETVISYKSRTNLLTNMDQKSEKFLFAEINKRFPDHSIIAEEGSRKDTSGDYIWYVDPLDGTNNYAHGIPFFCVSIGVFSRRLNRITAGAVYIPFADEMFHAVKNAGAFLNGSPIRVSDTGSLGISVVATGFPYDKGNSKKNNIREFNAMLPRIQGIRRMGAAAIDLCYVSSGWLDGYWEQGLAPWDMAAGSLIVSEAGGRVTAFSGEAFDPEFPQVLASNGKIHDEMMTVLSTLSSPADD